MQMKTSLFLEIKKNFIKIIYLYAEQHNIYIYIYIYSKDFNQKKKNLSLLYVFKKNTNIGNCLMLFNRV